MQPREISEPEPVVRYFPETQSLWIDSGKSLGEGETIAKGVVVFYGKEDSTAAEGIRIELAEQALKPFVDAIIAKHTAKPKQVAETAEGSAIMTAQTSAPLNLELIGEIFTAIAAERAPLVPERFTSDYPDEDVAAYVAAFLDPNLVVLMEDALPKPTVHAVKPAVRELARKIRNSGGWKLAVERYGIDKMLIGIMVKEGIAHADDVTAAVSKVIEALMSAM